jgi:hypothetical protein
MNLFILQSDNIFGNLSTVSSNSTEIYNSINLIENCKTNISLIPNNDKSNLVLKYKTPLILSAHNSTIASIFPGILGNYTDSQSLVGVSYNTVDKIFQRLNNLRLTVDSFLLIKDQTIKASN